MSLSITGPECSLGLTPFQPIIAVHLVSHSALELPESSRPGIIAALFHNVFFTNLQHRSRTRHCSERIRESRRPVLERPFLRSITCIGLPGKPCQTTRLQIRIALLAPHPKLDSRDLDVGHSCVSTG